MESAWEARKRRIRAAMPAEPKVLIRKIETTLLGGLQPFIGQVATPEVREAVKTAVRAAMLNYIYASEADPAMCQVEVRQADDDPNAFVIVPLNEETDRLLKRLQAEGKL